MGKERKLLLEIVKQFQHYQSLDVLTINVAKKKINNLFNQSLNKSDLVRKILNEVVLSDDEIIDLLKICFKKKSEL